MAAPSSRRPLTFGVEMEMLLATLPDGKADPHPDDPRSPYGLTQEPGQSNAAYRDIQRHIAKTLRDAGFSANIQGESGMSQAANTWVVRRDASLAAIDEYYTWYQVEVNSPALYARPEAMAVVEKVCVMLNATYRINVNTSCGLHVHVGDGVGGFPFAALQNFMATAWAFADLFDLAHPQSRLDNDGYCPGVLRNSNLLDQLSQIPLDQRTVEQLVDIKERGIRKIFSVKDEDEDEILEMFFPLNSDGRSAFNMENLVKGWPTPPGKKTIEFRQHEGTTDPERIHHWVSVCVGMVDFAMEISREKLVPFLFRKVRDPDFGLVELLNSMGLPRQARYYGLLACERREEADLIRQGKKQLPRPRHLSPLDSWMYSNTREVSTNPMGLRFWRCGSGDSTSQNSTDGGADLSGSDDNCHASGSKDGIDLDDLPEKDTAVEDIPDPRAAANGDDISGPMKSNNMDLYQPEKDFIRKEVRNLLDLNQNEDIDDLLEDDLSDLIVDDRFEDLCTDLDNLLAQDTNLSDISNLLYSISEEKEEV